MHKSFSILMTAATAAMLAAVPAFAQSNGGMAASPMSPPANNGATSGGTMAGSGMPSGGMSDSSAPDSSMGGMSSKGSTASKPMTRKKMHHKKPMHKAAKPSSGMTPNM